MNLESVRKAYSRWSSIYDLVFGPLFAHPRRQGIEMLEIVRGQRVLEVGVGTGLSFPEFPHACSAFGIDISRPMLERARRRLGRPGTGIVEGNASCLPFGDDSFDAALAPYVLSAMPDPVGMLREVVRVVRPGGPIVLVNHFVSGNRLLSSVERALTKATTRLLGFHSDFDVAPVLQAAELEIVQALRAPPLRYWQVMHVVASRQW